MLLVNSQRLNIEMENLKGVIFAFLIVICGVQAATAQGRNYTLQFPAVSFVPDEESDLAGALDELRGGNVGDAFGLVQFSRVPSHEEKAEMAATGIDLQFYVRSYAWFVTVSSNVQAADLQDLPIRFLSPIKKEWKLSRELLLENYPTLALIDADNIRLDLYRFQGVDAVELNSAIETAGGVVTGRSELLVSVSTAITNIAALAELPFVYYISSAAPSPELEQEVNRTNHRSNQIATDYLGGLKFDGTGVTVAVSEGMADTTQIDFHGRIDPSYHGGSSFSGHATGVCRRMAGAGNQNPLNRGMAFGSDILTVGGSAWNNQGLYNSEDLRVANHSYGWGCSGGYNGASVTIDKQIREQSAMMHVFSCGNIGGSTSCTYYGAPTWANITGAPKQSKNCIATGALNKYDTRMGFSSKGPAYDGRIKPDMCAVGPGGTSHAAPGVSGVIGQLHHVYKTFNNGADPDAGLLKGILQNTAEDLGKPGPDFKFGYGRINALRAYELIKAGNHLTDSIDDGDTNSYSLTVPSGVRDVRIMLYWSDKEATSGASAALVNDLDFQVFDPSNALFEPWVLDTAADSASLEKPAIRARDSLNNMEQVTIEDPSPGTYTLDVLGSLVPSGPQKYYVIHEFRYDELTLTHPAGGEGLKPGDNETLHWDSYGTKDTFSLEFSADSGMTWSIVVTGIDSNKRNYDWTIPDTISGHCFLRMSRGGVADTNDAPFSIIQVPTNLDVLWSCGDSAMFTWDAVAGATAYEVSRLGAKYMDSVTTTTKTHHKFTGLSLTDPEWFSVRALGALDARGRRAVAYQWIPGDTNCVPYNANLIAVHSPAPGYIPDCIAGGKLPVEIEIQNKGTADLTNIPVFFQVDSGAIQSDSIAATIGSANDLTYVFSDSIDLSAIGPHTIAVWVAYPGDTLNDNDSIFFQVETYASTTVTPQDTQTFDQFTNCSTAWGCASISCALSQGWFNIPNTPATHGDSIDFRTDLNGTGTGGTGPSGDHTSGSGKYLYLEGSGNSGGGCLWKPAFLHSPCYDLTNTKKAELSFWYHMYGGGIGWLRVDAFVDGKWDMNITPEIVGNQGNSWYQRKVDLSAYAGKVIVIRFRGSTGGGFASDLAIDDIYLNAAPNVSFSASPLTVCASDTVQMSDSSFFTDSWLWEISPSGATYVAGTDSTSQNPQLIFTNPTTYTVKMIGTNSFAADSITKTTYINAGPHTATLTASDSSICLGDTVSFTASQLTGSIYHFLVGNDTVKSGLSNSYTTDTIQDSQVVSVLGEVHPSCFTNQPLITMSVTEQPQSVISLDTSACPIIAFTATSTGGAATNWTWDFGDSSATSSQQNPTHDYSNAGIGTYTVSLIGNNMCGSDTTTVMVPINCIVNSQLLTMPEFKLFPNPTTGVLNVEINDAIAEDVKLIVTNLKGQKVMAKQFSVISGKLKTTIDLGDLASGLYNLKIVAGNQIFLGNIALER